MKVSDFIVLFLANKGITDVFGYPGGMVTHLMDSFDKYSDRIKAHVNYHEQASSFCACGYAQTSNLPGVAYSTSGPGATNLVTGIANAFFDSIPCIFLTGQVNTYEGKGNLRVRQRGFQETDIVSIVKSITKYAAQITDAEKVKYELEKAFYICMNNRPGPVLLDIPMNILRADIQPESLQGFQNYRETNINYNSILDTLFEALKHSERPLIIAGAGIRTAGQKTVFNELVEKIRIPVVSSMIGVDCLPTCSPYYFGFIGAYGHRRANFLIAKSDCIVTIGSRLDSRQTGVNKDLFAQNARILRIDIDEGEVMNQVKENETVLICNIKELLSKIIDDKRSNNQNIFENWLVKCNKIKNSLEGLDIQYPNQLVKLISNYIPEDAIVTTDVGQNQVWIAQSFNLKAKQKILFSGGHGAMGYSLPAAIGAYYASRRPVICFVGDGGFQMNIQELQYIVRENIPIKIILLNNHSLGMIRHFQEMYFDFKFTQTTTESGYSVPDFCRITEAYGILSIRIDKMEECAKLKEIVSSELPVFIDVNCGNQTYVYPKLAMNKPIHDQDPLIDRKLFNELINGD